MSTSVSGVPFSPPLGFSSGRVNGVSQHSGVVVAIKTKSPKGAQSDSTPSGRHLWYQSTPQRSDSGKTYSFLAAIAGPNNVVITVSFDKAYGSKVEAMAAAALIWLDVPLDEGEYIRQTIAEAEEVARQGIKDIAKARKAVRDDKAKKEDVKIA